MKILSKYARSTRNASSLKSLPTLALAVIGSFCSSSSVFATPLVGSALASFAVQNKAGVTNFSKFKKISGNFGSAKNTFVGGEYTSVFSRADFTFVGSVEEKEIIPVEIIPFVQPPQLDLDAEINALNSLGPIPDIDSYLTGPTLPVAGSESNGGFDQVVNIQSVTAVPEPATLALLGLGLAGLGFVRRRYC